MHPLVQSCPVQDCTKFFYSPPEIATESYLARTR